ncbi:hypothetical protein Tco_1300976 [Tanacetum coccineum]
MSEGLNSNAKGTSLTPYKRSTQFGCEDDDSKTTRASRNFQLYEQAITYVILFRTRKSRTQQMNVQVQSGSKVVPTAVQDSTSDKEFHYYSQTHNNA